MKKQQPSYLERCQVLWIAEIIEAETSLTWQQAKEIAQRISDEMASKPELFPSQGVLQK